MDTIFLRIVDGADTGALVLAGNAASDVYLLNAENIPVYLDGDNADISALEDGMMAELTYSGAVEETWPAKFAEVKAISVYSLGAEKNPGGGAYDLCGLYLQVLNDLWDRDSGLNSGISYLSVDLSEAPGALTDGEKSAIAWIFACEHDAEPLALSYDGLIEQGYITVLEYASRPAGVPELYEWKDGILFAITAGEREDAHYSLPVIMFNAEKWRAPLGAYCLSNCVASWPEMGTWSGYSIGSEAIS